MRRELTNFSDDHCHQQGAWGVLELLDGEDAMADSSRDLLTEGHGTDKLAYGGQDTGLDEGQGP